MKELSLHILDIAQNSISAGATNIWIEVEEKMADNTFTISIQDDGKGIAPDMIEKVTDPFYTSRTTRKVGMGLPLLKQNAQMAGGDLSIESQQGRGTRVEACFVHDHLDRPPLGDIAGVIVLLVSANPQIEWQYKHRIDASEYIFDTVEIKEVLDDIPLHEPSVGRYLKEMLIENINELTTAQTRNGQSD